MSNFIKEIKWKFQEVKRLPKATYLCWKYPFLKYWKSKGPFYTNCWYYAIPEGWRKAFGIQMIKEINESLKRTDGRKAIKAFSIQDIKEKWGELQVYCYGTSEVYKILHKYEYISARTCINCGKPATVRSTGWICPYCNDCIGNRNYIHFGHRNGPSWYGWNGNMDNIPEDEWKAEEELLNDRNSTSN